jgi:ribosomal protein L11 methyltransferase
MPWQSLTLDVNAAEAEALSDALLDEGAVSVCVEDADAGTEAEVPRYAEPSWEASPAWRRNRLSVLLAQATGARPIVERAARAAGLRAAPEFSVSDVPDDDWVRRSQSQFEPMAIGRRLWIVPSWHEPPDLNSAIVRLDPGMAFGTGSHPTTRLVLEFLARELRGGERVLDYGCGSGILAIAAAKLGAGGIDAVDVDPQALKATAENARANTVVAGVWPPEALPPGEYDVVVANILSNPLVLLAPLISARVRAGGQLALSGILEDQVPDVISAYGPAVALCASGREGGWVLLEGKRR